MQTARLFPVLFCACIAPAWAGTPIHLQHDASPTVLVNVSNVKGTVSITAWDRNVVAVGGDLGSGAQPLAISGDRDKLDIQVKSRGGSGWLNWGGDNAMGPTTLQINVPKGASITVNVVSAPLVARGLDGGSIKVNSVSGRVRVDARTPSLTIDSVSGNIELGGHAAQSDLQTVSGDIGALVLGSEARLQTISGHVKVDGGPWQKLRVSTVSGAVQLHGPLAPGGSIDVDSMSGDVGLQLPADTSATLHASSFSGDLQSDFGKAQTAGHGPGTTLDSRLGNGRGSVKIESFSGDLTIGKQR